MLENETSRLSRVRPLATLSIALVFGTGCGAQVQSEQEEQQEPAVVSKSALDPEILEAAMRQQASAETQGVMLHSRVWLARDAYVASYEAMDGTVFATQMIGKNSLTKGLPTFVQGEAPADFMKRVGPHTSAPITDMTNDEAWFTLDRAETQDEVGATGSGERVASTTEALSPLEEVAAQLKACDAQAKAGCDQTVGYYMQGLSGPPVDATNGRWSRTGMGGASFQAFGSGAYAAVCAHGGIAHFAWKERGARLFNISPSTFVTDVPPLAFLGFVVGMGWRQEECPFGSASCIWKTTFNPATQTFSATQSANGPIQTFCGRITDQRTINTNFRCLFNNSLSDPNCPVFVSGVPNISLVVN